MPYLDTYSMTLNGALRGRLAAAAATEPTPPADPEGWVNEQRWALCSAPGWDEAWASALAGGVEDPGADAGVITDAMILSQTQAVLAG
jgi:hypothetical protein